MGNEAIEGMVTVATAIVVVAIIAVLVSKNAQTGSVLTAGGKALSGAIGAAVAPVSGSSTSTLSAASTQLGHIGGIFDSSGNYIGE